jgi:protein-tyrosine kinase
MAGAIERALKKQSVAVPDAALRASEESIGEILVAQGVLNASEVAEVATFARDKNLRFGEAAVSQKKIRQEELDQALAQQYRFPYVKVGKGTLSKEVITAYKPFSKQAELFRYIRAQLMLGTVQNDQKVIAIVSPSKKDGRSYLAANLAVAFAQLGKKTLLLDCHMQESRQQEMFNIQRAPGVSALLSGRSEVDCGPTPIEEIGNLSVLQAGPCPPNPDELIAGNAFVSLISKVRREYDIVLVDTPPGDTSTAVDWIATRCGSALIVYRRDKTKLSDASDFASRMLARTSVIGTVMSSH